MKKYEYDDADILRERDLGLRLLDSSDKYGNTIYKQFENSDWYIREVDEKTFQLFETKYTFTPHYVDTYSSLLKAFNAGEKSYE